MSSNVTHLTGKNGEKTGVYTLTPKNMPAGEPTAAELFADDDLDAAGRVLDEGPSVITMTPAEARSVIEEMTGRPLSANILASVRATDRAADRAWRNAETARVSAETARRLAQEARDPSDKIIRHIHDRPTATPTISAKIDKNTRGFNYEVTVTGCNSPEQLASLMAEARTAIEATLPAMPANKSE